MIDFPNMSLGQKFLYSRNRVENGSLGTPNHDHPFVKADLSLTILQATQRRHNGHVTSTVRKPSL